MIHRVVPLQGAVLLVNRPKPHIKIRIRYHWSDFTSLKCCLLLSILGIYPRLGTYIGIEQEIMSYNLRLPRLLSPRRLGVGRT